MQDTQQSRAAAEAARALAGSRSLAMLTGAGISAESGVPTFRDAQTRLWARFDPLQLATPTAFAIHPKLVWDWYAWRRELVASVQPNLAHDALVEVERRIPDCLLITQNVDDLHRRAGSRKLVELHGNIGRVKLPPGGCPSVHRQSFRRNRHRDQFQRDGAFANSRLRAARAGRPRVAGIGPGGMARYAPPDHAGRSFCASALSEGDDAFS